MEHALTTLFFHCSLHNFASFFGEAHLCPFWYDFCCFCSIFFCVEMNENRYSKEAPHENRCYRLSNECGWSDSQIPSGTWKHKNGRTRLVWTIFHLSREVWSSSNQKKRRKNKPHTYLPKVHCKSIPRGKKEGPKPSTNKGTTRGIFFAQMLCLAGWLLTIKIVLQLSPAFASVLNLPTLGRCSILIGNCSEQTQPQPSRANKMVCPRHMHSTFDFCNPKEFLIYSWTMLYQCLIFLWLKVVQVVTRYWISWRTSSA